MIDFRSCINNQDARLLPGILCDVMISNKLNCLDADHADSKKRARHVTESARENIEYLIDEIRETTDRVIEEGIELTKDKKAELLAAIEAGKKAMEEETKDISQERLQSTLSC